LDDETLGTEGYTYLYVNSYAFCGPVSKFNMVIYDRQTPQMIDSMSGRKLNWFKARPFLFVSSLAHVSLMSKYVTRLERERGPLANSVLFSLKDTNPFDETRAKQVIVIPTTMDKVVDIPEGNSSMVYFSGGYSVMMSRPYLVLGRGKGCSYHYLTFPNDIVASLTHKNSRIESPNVNLIFWSSQELLQVGNYSVRMFNNNGKPCYLYYVKLDRTEEAYIRMNKSGRLVSVVLSVNPESNVVPWRRVVPTKETGFENGLCMNYIRNVLGRSYSILKDKPGYKPSKELLLECQEFCATNCNHRKKER